MKSLIISDTRIFICLNNFVDLPFIKFPLTINATNCPLIYQNFEKFSCQQITLTSKQFMLQRFLNTNPIKVKT